MKPGTEHPNVPGTIRFLPDGVDVPLVPGESLLSHALRGGVPHRFSPPHGERSGTPPRRAWERSDSPGTRGTSSPSGRKRIVPGTLGCSVPGFINTGSEYPRSVGCRIYET